MYSNIKEKDIILVWSPELLNVKMVEVYEIFISKHGSYIFECFDIKPKLKGEWYKTDFTNYYYYMDVVGKLEADKVHNFIVE